MIPKIEIHYFSVRGFRKLRQLGAAVLLPAMIVAPFLSAWAAGPDLIHSFQQTARDFMKDKSRAIVPIKVVLKLKMRKQEQERKIEVNGVVIDKDGLTFVSAMSIDPAAAYNSYQNESGRSLSSRRSMMDSDVTEAMIVLSDGTELEAEVVLKDADLDMAFIRPKEKPPRPFDYFDLAKSAATPAVLDEVFVLNRLGPTEDRAPIITPGTIRAVVNGPRTYYICDDLLSKNLGTMVFSKMGLPIGVLVAKQSQNPGVLGMGYDNLPIAVLRPLEDLIEVADQARQVRVKKAPESVDQPTAAKVTEIEAVPAGGQSE
jgi:S1-C subfamily serine protease